MNLRKLILILDGLLLGSVGIHIILKARVWLIEFSYSQIIIVLILGLILSFVKFRYVFLKFNNKNILRIFDKNIVIKFYNLFTKRDLIVILLMSLIGITLRVILKIPVIFLAPVYFGIGLALFLSFFQYLFAVLSKNK